MSAPSKDGRLAGEHEHDRDRVLMVLVRSVSALVFLLLAMTVVFALTVVDR